MKKLTFATIAFALLALSAVHVYASDRVDKFVAQYQSHAGFSPRPQSVTLKIRENGDVRYEVYSLRHSEPVTSKLIAKLSRESVKSIVSQNDQLDQADLVDLDLGKPRCMDAPSSHYSVQNSKGEVIEIAARRSCHHFEMQSTAAESVKTILDGLLALAYLD